MAVLKVYIVTFLDDSTVEVTADKIKQFLKENGRKIKLITLKKTGGDVSGQD